MAKQKQEVMTGFAQETIPAIESAISKADEKRAIIEGLNDELKNLEFKVTEALHLHRDQLDKQEDKKGNSQLVYKRGDFKAVLKGHERLSYDKVRKAGA